METAVCTTAEDEDDVLLPYAFGPEGKLIHARDVATGLACGCTCPGCGERLRAHHPGPDVPGRRRQRRHHFKHHRTAACSGAMESVVHLLAKDSLLAADRLRLPAGAARVEGMEPRPVLEQRDFSYERPEDEVRAYDGFVPDAVIRRGDAELLVEFWWRHQTERDKVALIRAQDRSCVEIDLRRMPLHATDEEQRRFVLFDAPRHWLHNRRIAAAEAEMRVLRAAQLARERQRNLRAFGALAEEVAAAWRRPARPGHPGWRDWAEEVGLAAHVGLEIAGGAAMVWDGATWQAAVLREFAGTYVANLLTADVLVGRLRALSMFKPPLDRDLVWIEDAVATVRQTTPDFLRPAEIVGAYADALVERAVLVGRGRGSARRWQMDFALSIAVKERKQASLEAKRREGELDELVSSLSQALGEPLAAVLAEWADASPPGVERSPREVARSGGDGWSRLRRDVEALTAMAAPGGRAVDEDRLLGLPLGELRALRAREAAAREAEWQRKRELERHEAAERRRAESAACVDRALVEARLLLGHEEGAAWVAAAVARRVEGAFEETRTRLGPFEIRAVQEDLDALHDRVERQRDAERRRAIAEGIAAQAVTDRRERLRRKAFQANRSDTDRAEMWMRNYHRTLDCSPWDACKTEAGYARADDILDGIIRGGGRRR